MIFYPSKPIHGKFVDSLLTVAGLNAAKARIKFHHNRMYAELFSVVFNMLTKQNFNQIC
jgi:hypothetical protein